MPESITITDNRNGESMEIPLVNGGVSAEEWAKLLPGVWFFDPGFMSTAACESAITYLDGDAGILRYRGYLLNRSSEDLSAEESCGGISGQLGAGAWCPLRGRPRPCRRRRAFRDDAVVRDGAAYERLGILHGSRILGRIPRQVNEDRCKRWNFRRNKKLQQPFHLPFSAGFPC